MSRYKPPRPPSSKYITLEGHRLLQEELDFLWRKKRPEVTKAITAAAAEGDRSENAEYIYRKKQLREIDYRVRFLRKRLEGMKIVDTIPSDHSKIYFGAWVELLDEQEVMHQYRIVGPDEFSRNEKYISMDSPLAKSLMGKSIDDEVSIHTPKGQKFYEIAGVSYSES
ncbi:MAG: transcription elongation factor GreB [Thiohalomonadales bacterium]